MTRICSYCGLPKRRTKCSECGGSKDKIIEEQDIDIPSLKEEGMIILLVILIILIIVSIPILMAFVGT